MNGDCCVPLSMTYDEVLKRMEKKIVAIKPDWTIGVMPETSSGIEPMWPLTYTRRVARVGDVMMNGVVIGQVKNWEADFSSLEEPVYELKAADEPYDIVREWMKPIQIECTRYRIAEEAPPPGITYESVMAAVERRAQLAVDLDIVDHLNIIADYKRDPGFESWMARVRDAAVEAARWYNPCATFMLDPVTKTESKMDWDEAEEITEPGPAPTTSDPFDGMAAFPPGQYPQIDGESIAKTDRCYFCARGQYLTRFFRDPNDSVLTCVTCLYDHLRWELHEDGTLTPVPSE